MKREAPPLAPPATGWRNRSALSKTCALISCADDDPSRPARPVAPTGDLARKLTKLCLNFIAILPCAAIADGGTDAASLPTAVFHHFDHLVTETSVDGVPVDVVNIYSLAPDYTYAAEPQEGYACVDDAARAIILLSVSLEREADDKKLHQLKLLIAFVLRMQNENGYFNNFIWPNGSINITDKTSLAELNWWSLRALWGLEAGLRILPKDSDLSRQTLLATDRLVANLKRDLKVKPRVTQHKEGLDVPNWLPMGSGADQAAVAIIALLRYYDRTHDDKVLNIITAMADGVMLMQAGDARHFPYGAHLSWRNEWHAWGSDQAYALLLAGQRLGRPDYVQGGLLEVDHFYPYVIRRGYLSTLNVRKVGDQYLAIRQERFPQIAYGIRPMVYAAIEAYRITGKQRYLATALHVASWLTGTNDAHQAMYDPASGRIFDGIGSGAKVNRNSGAESTVEGLLALQDLESVARR
jgi:hypothetical protein